MFAAYASSLSADMPLSALTVGEISPPTTPLDWVRVDLKAAALNHHDLWSLRGVGLGREQLPMILGCDGAGVCEDGREVIVHGLIGSSDFTGDEVMDPKRTILSEKYPGTLAEHVWVPARNAVAKPAGLSWEEAACLPVSYLTAYRMLFSVGQLRPGQTVLIQGVGGGVSTAAAVQAKAAGARVWMTSRTEERRDWAINDLGADAAFSAGERLPSHVDLVIETVGEATWGHSLRALHPGGAVVVAGATSGGMPPAELNRVFFRGLRVLGSTMGTRVELELLSRFMVTERLAPVIDRVLPFSRVAEGFAALEAGDVFGKIVVTF